MYIVVNVSAVCSAPMGTFDRALHVRTRMAPSTPWFRITTVGYVAKHVISFSKVAFNDSGAAVALNKLNMSWTRCITPSTSFPLTWRIQLLGSKKDRRYSTVAYEVNRGGQSWCTSRDCLYRYEFYTSLAPPSTAAIRQILMVII
jgi:hypothetical protein